MSEVIFRGGWFGSSWFASGWFLGDWFHFEVRGQTPAGSVSKGFARRRRIILPDGKEFDGTEEELHDILKLYRRKTQRVVALPDIVLEEPIEVPQPVIQPVPKPKPLSLTAEEEMLILASTAVQMTPLPPITDEEILLAA